MFVWLHFIISNNSVLYYLLWVNVETVVLRPLIKILGLVVPCAPMSFSHDILVKDRVPLPRQPQVVLSLALRLSQDRVGQVDLDKVLVIIFRLCRGPLLAVRAGSQLVRVKLKLRQF